MRNVLDLARATYPDLDITLIQNLQGLEQHADEIDAFVNGDGVNSSIHHQSVFLKHYLGEQNGKRKQWLIMLVRQAGSICCLIPVYTEARKVPVKLGILRLFNFRMIAIRLFGEVVSWRHDFPAAHASTLVGLMMNHPDLTFDLAMIEALNTQDAVFGMFNSKNASGFVVKPMTIKSQPVHSIKFPESWDAYINGMRKKRRYNLKRNIKILEDKFAGSIVMKSYSSASDVAPFLQHLDHLYGRTWQGRTFGGKSRNTDSAQRFETMAASIGCMHSYVLEIEGNPVAFVRGYLHNHIYYYEEIGYDLQWSEYNVGTVLTYMMLQQLMSEPGKVKELLLGYGDSVYKQVFGNHEYQAFNSYLCREGSVASKIVALVQMCDRVYLKLREWMIRLEIDGKIRKILKNRNSAAEVSPEASSSDS